MAAPPLLSAPAHHGPPLVPSRPQVPAGVISDSRIRMRWTGPRIRPRYEICFPRGSDSRPPRHSPASVCSPLLSEPLLRDCVKRICRLDRRPFPPALPVVTRLRRLTAYVWLRLRRAPVIEPDLYTLSARGSQQQKSLCVRVEAHDQARHAGAKSTNRNGSAPISNCHDASRTASWGLGSTSSDISKPIKARACRESGGRERLRGRTRHGISKQ